MPGTSDTLASSRLRRLAQPAGQSHGRDEAAAATAEEVCELCGQPIASDHRHLVDLSEHSLKCTCRACSLLFEKKGAGAGRYRLVPDRRLALEGFELGDELWQRMRIPVEMAFFFHSTPAERTVAFYPGPMGATESLLDLEAWGELEAANPVLEGLEPDVEALLVNRAGGARSGHWLVPIDDCYDLAGLMRTHWQGLSGGQQVWEEIGAFFDRLQRRAKVVDRKGERQRSTPPATTAAGDRKEPAWPT